MEIFKNKTFRFFAVVLGSVASVPLGLLVFVVSAYWIEHADFWGYPDGEINFVGKTRGEVLDFSEAHKLNGKILIGTPYREDIISGTSYFDTKAEVEASNYIMNLKMWGVNTKSSFHGYYWQVLYFDSSSKVYRQGIYRYFDW